jgi:hypothetical protein
MTRASKRRLGLLAVAIGVYALAVRPRMLRYGATNEEIEGDFPGRHVIPGGRRGATMATTINAPPPEVWPWLIQMGCDRAGWYSWDRLDNGGRPSAETIHPEWQHIALGDHLASLPDGSAWFEVAALEPERFLGLRATLDIRGRPVHPDGPKPRFHTDSLWCFLLHEQPDSRTRLVISGYDASTPRPFQALMNFIFWEPAHWIMQARQWSNLRRRVERSPTGGGSAGVST